MAKYCVKCGKALPEGEEICSECNGHPDNGDDAALFTRMTAETEIWKESEDHSKRRRRAKLIRSNRQKILLYSGAVLLVAFTVFIILFTQPVARVSRALGAGDYEKALNLYTEKLAGEETRSGRIDKALLTAAEDTVRAFAAQELSSREAERALDTLGGFGDFTGELLAPAMDEYESLRASRENMDRADKLFTNGEYLLAYDCYEKVLESDALYEQAQARTQECLTEYAASVLRDAGEYIIRDDYTAAIRVLKEGNDKLAGYDTYSEDIDAKLLDCYDLYEGYILTEARNLAELGDYSAAAELIRSCTRDFGYETDSLLAALEGYELQAQDKLLSDAAARADEFYAAGAYTDAFAELESVGAQLGEEEAESLAGAVEALEQRFAQDMIQAADELFAGDREKLDEAIAALDAALEIRPLEELTQRREELQALVPVSLVEMDFSAKEGVIYRNDSAFESLVDGVTYTDGWLWGDNGASVTFALDGKFDTLEAVFTDRRSDGVSASGSFEVWCDGVLAYTSQTIYHGTTGPVRVELSVTGCRELKLVFTSNYEVSTAESGYCYHGLCSPVVMKNIGE